MATSIPTTQWTRVDEPLLGTLTAVYLIEVNGVLGVTDDATQATHMLQRDAASGVVGVEAYSAGASQLIRRNNVIIPVRITEV